MITAAPSDGLLPLHPALFVREDAIRAHPGAVDAPRSADALPVHEHAP